MDVLNLLYTAKDLGLTIAIKDEQVSISGNKNPATIAVVQELAKRKHLVLTAYHLTCRYNLLMSKPLLMEETQELFHLADKLRLPKPVIQRIHLGNVHDKRFGTIEEIQPEAWRP